MHDKRLWLSAFILALSVTVIFEAVPANAQWWLVPPLKTTSYIRGQGRIRIRREETEATHQLYFRPCWWNYDICADQWGDSQVSGYYGGWTSLGGFGPGPQTTVSFNTSAFVNPENLIDVRVWSDHYDFDSGFIGYARHAINNPYGTVDQVHGAIEFNGRFYCGDQNNPATWRDISDLVWSSNYFLGAACFEDWRRVSSGGDRDFNDISLVADLVPGTTLVHRHIGYAGTVPLSSCAAYGYAYDESRGGARQDVRVYVNSTLVATVTANQYNTSDPGVCAAVGGNCGFSLDLTPYVTTGVTYQIEARTNDVLWGNRWVPLTDSPKTLTCVVPTPTTTPTPTVTPTNIATPTATATAGPRLTPTPLPTATSTSGPRATPTPINTATYTPSPTQTNTPTPTVTHTPSPAPTNTSTPTATPTALAALTLSRDHEFLLLCGATVGEPTQVLRGVLSGDTYSGQLIRIVIVDPNGSTGNYYTYTDPFGRFILDASSANGDACFGSSLTGDWSAQAFYDPLGLVSNPVQWSVSWFIIQTTK